MGSRTTPRQRQEFYQRHLQGETYSAIAQHAGLSLECVRYWCRRLRDGRSCQTHYRRDPPGALAHFRWRVRYVILRLRLAHPRWGPNRIRAKLLKSDSLRGLPLPSESRIGAYLRQWPRFRRPPREKAELPRPKQPQAVHQRWQIDFKLRIALQDGTLVNLHTVRDPVGEACIGAVVFAAGHRASGAQNVTWEQVRAVLRSCFARWGLLPAEVQTDSESALVAHGHDPFPSKFTLWLTGLGIAHLVIRPGRPTDNAEVERCHRTVCDYAVRGNEKATVAQLQELLDQAVYELAFELPSRAAGCGRQPPIVAHPELLPARRSFCPEHELALFDRQRVDRYLAALSWERKVGQTGQIELGGQHEYYSVGRACAGRQVIVRFDPTDRHFVFYAVDAPDQEIGRRPARGLEVADLTGLEVWPAGCGPQQLPLPLVFEGVNC